MNCDMFTDIENNYGIICKEITPINDGWLNNVLSYMQHFLSCLQMGLLKKVQLRESRYLLDSGRITKPVKNRFP